MSKLKSLLFSYQTVTDTVLITDIVRTDDSKLLQESNLTARQPRREPHHVMQATPNEELARGSYVAVREGFEPATLLTEGAELITEPARPNGRHHTIRHEAIPFEGRRHW